MKKISFVISEVKLHEHLSIMALSAVLKKAGHSVDLVFFQNDPLNINKIVKALKQEPPDFIALSFMSNVKEHYLDLAKKIKDEVKKPIIIGGPAATFDHDLQYCNNGFFDGVCVGEGDLALVNFIDKYSDSKQIKKYNNFIVPDHRGGFSCGNLMDLVDPLDQLPFPDRGIVYEKDDFLKFSKIKMFMSGRGCPYQCTYCFNHKYNALYRGKGKIVRHKSVDYFLEEILSVKKDYPIEGIIFEDDIFIMNKPWLEQFAQKYPQKIGLPYMCYVRPNLVTEEIAKLLKLSGCVSTRVAIECGNEPLRNDVLKRNLQDKEILRSCEILHNAGLKVGTINILGLPTETIENMQQTLTLNRACKPEHVSANMFMPLPGVDLTFYAIEEDLLDREFASPKSTHHLSQMKYPKDVKDFLYPFKALFPFFVMSCHADKIMPLVMKWPYPVLKLFDSLYRLYYNAQFYPKVKFSLRDKFRALKRYLSIVTNN